MGQQANPISVTLVGRICHVFMLAVDLSKSFLVQRLIIQGCRITVLFSFKIIEIIVIMTAIK